VQEDRGGLDPRITIQNCLATFRLIFGGINDEIVLATTTTILAQTWAVLAMGTRVSNKATQCGVLEHGIEVAPPNPALQRTGRCT
jgi:hypothetical protein